MTSTVHELYKLGLVRPPQWLPANTHYETMMGSVAYGVSTDMSDMDVYGFCIPPKDVIFPHLAGEIMGFGKQHKRFEQYQEQHIHNNGREYDISIYSIVKYFQLCMDNNPNMVDSLYTPINCVLTLSRIGSMVRENRDMFLHKGYYHKARGYAYSQLSKIKHTEATTGKRKDLIDRYGYDTKFAYHIVRLLDQTDQVLETGTLDLQRSKDVMRAVRNGEWSEEQLRDYFNQQERYLANKYNESNLQYSPNEGAIKTLLLSCLEEHYGSLSEVVKVPDREATALKEIYDIVSKVVH